MSRARHVSCRPGVNAMELQQSASASLHYNTAAVIINLNSRVQFLPPTSAARGQKHSAAGCSPPAWSRRQHDYTPPCSAGLTKMQFCSLLALNALRPVYVQGNPGRSTVVQVTLKPISKVSYDRTRTVLAVVIQSPWVPRNELVGGGIKQSDRIF